MPLPDTIIRSLKQIDKPSDFQAYRDILKARPNLPPNEWSKLCALVKTNKLYGILRMDLSKKEAEVLGSALKKVSLTHVDAIIEVVIAKGGDAAPILLKHILEKRKKVDQNPIRLYLCDRLKEGVSLRYLQLLHVVYKYYPSCIDTSILEFCRSNDHPICKEVLKLETDAI